MKSQFPLFIFLFLHFTSSSSSSSSNPNSNVTLILQDVLTAISSKYNWHSNQFTIDVAKVRFATPPTRRFRIGSGYDPNNSSVTLQFSDQVSSWNKFKTTFLDLPSLIRRLASLAHLSTFELRGPFQLRADQLHTLALSLPMNVSYTGLKHILVGEGITVEVTRAQEISLFYSSDLDLQMNGSIMCSKGKSDFWPFQQSSRVPLFPIRISGSASLVAYRSRNRHAYIATTLISKDTVELLPEKCYDGQVSGKLACPIDSTSLRLSMLDKILRILLSRKILQDQYFGLLKANIRASAVVKFPLELDRDIGSNVTLNRTIPDWRTRPSIERVWFEVLARVEENRLKPISIKKIKPFIESDSISWANLMSNMSYTKLRPILLPPEALTLDVKW